MGDKDRLAEDLVRVEKERDHYEELYEKHIAYIELLQHKVDLYGAALAEISAPIPMSREDTMYGRDVRLSRMQMIARTTLQEGEMSGAQRQVGEDNA